MKILLVAPVIPFPINDGMSLHIHNFFKRLGLRHNLHLLCLDRGNKNDFEEIKKAWGDYCPMIKNVSLEYRPEQKRKTWIKSISNNISPAPDSLSAVPYVKEMDSEISKLLAEYKYDLIYVVSGYMAQYFLKRNSVPILIDLADDPALRVYRQMHTGKGIFKKLKLLRWWHNTKRYEKKYFTKFRYFTFVSYRDATYFDKICPKRIVKVIPNGVDLEYFSPQDKKSDDLSLVFTGVMNFEPNSDAVIYFYQEIFPIIRKEFPEIKFTIVGKDPAKELLQIADKDKNVKCAGYVRDVRPYLREASVFVCPMRSGSGIKNKVLEAMAMALPVVSTNIGCEAIEAIPNESVLIANSPKSFAEAVIKLLQDKALRNSIGLAGRKLVETKYNWDKSVQELDSFLRQIVNHYAEIK